jgi:hypothetical protein
MCEYKLGPNKHGPDKSRPNKVGSRWFALRKRRSPQSVGVGPPSFVDANGRERSALPLNFCADVL